MSSFRRTDRARARTLAIALLFGGCNGAGLVLYTTDGASFDSGSDVVETDADAAAMDGCGDACADMGSFGEAAFYDVPDG